MMTRAMALTLNINALSSASISHASAQLFLLDYSTNNNIKVETSANHDSIAIKSYTTMKFVSLSILASIISQAAAFAPSPAFTSSRGLSTTELYADASIQFVKGLAEQVVPDIKLTRARDGSSGTATFRFKNPNVFDASTANEGEVTGMFLIDDEGELTTTDVNAKFINGKPEAIESMVVLKTAEEWDRFMRFMDRYGEANGLAFNKGK